MATPHPRSWTSPHFLSLNYSWKLFFLFNYLYKNFYLFPVLIFQNKKSRDFYSYLFWIFAKTNFPKFLRKISANFLSRFFAILSVFFFFFCLSDSRGDPGVSSNCFCLDAPPTEGAGERSVW